VTGDVPNYQVHAFAAGVSSIVFPQATVADVLVIGGGGSGGCNVGAGGGAGALIYYPGYTFAAGTYAVTVGMGGAVVSTTGPGNDGTASSIGSLFRATGGGGRGHVFRKH
jgi:hypothetical protein